MVGQGKVDRKQSGEVEGRRRLKSNYITNTMSKTWQAGMLGGAASIPCSSDVNVL